MAGAISAVAAVGGGGGNKKQPSIYNLTTLKKWSIINNRIPNVDAITHIHVYDFDNTLFASPLPNRQLWNTQSIGYLQGKDLFHGGGWWHDPEVLAMTGGGVEKEEPRAWQGWWNEKIVDLVRLSTQQANSLTVLLTGRAQGPFDDLIQRMVKSKKLEFDLICLKPQVAPTNESITSTMKFKQAFLSHLVQVYKSAEEMRIYEDRLNHVEQFRTFFADLNSKYPLDPSMPSDSPRNKPINTEVVEVVTLETSLDPVDECYRVKEMARQHNEKVRAGEVAGKKQCLYTVKKQVFYTGYLIQPQDTKRLLDMANLGSHGASKSHARFANSIVITTRHNVPPHVLQKVGGIGATLRWKVVALGNLDDKVIAARLQPVPLTASFYVEASVPHVLLATSGYQAKPSDSNRIQTWNDVPEHQQIEFDTRVGEKAALRLEEERFHRPNQQGPHAVNSNGKRQRPFDSDKDFPALPKPGGQARGFGSAAGGGGGGGRGGGRGGQKHDGGGGGKGGNNRQGGKGGGPPRGPANAGKKGGRGNFASYRSLDDVGAGGGAGGGGGSGGAGLGGVDGANDDGGLSY